MHVQFYVSSQEDFKKKNFIQMAQAGKRKAKRKKKSFVRTSFSLTARSLFRHLLKILEKKKKKKTFRLKKN